MNPLDGVYQVSRETVGGYDIVVKENDIASDRTLVLVHGIGVSSNYFHPLMNELADDIHVIALDLPGYGATETPDHELDINELAEVVNAFVKERALTHCVLVGHSMGTQVVTEAAVRQPSAYNACVLMAPTINKHERSLWQQTFRLLQDMLREPLLNNLVVMKGYVRMGPVRYLQTSESMFSDALEKDVSRLSIPLLIITGERDPIATEEWARLLQHVADRDEHVEIAGAAHNFQFSHPKETAEACFDFLGTF